MKKLSNILVVGTGNTLRGDDGIGAYVCSLIDKAGLAGVQTLVIQQLHTELVEDLLAFDTIVLVDASVSTTDVSFHPLIQNELQPVSSSHHVNASLLAALAQQLYQKEITMMVCAVKGENFDMSERLSATAKKNADTAFDSICKWVSNQYH